MSILLVNRSKRKHCVLHNGMITWNFLPDIFNSQRIIFNVQELKIRNFYVEKY